MWWCEIRTVGWMRQHCQCKVCDGICCVQACAWPSVDLEGATVGDFFVRDKRMKPYIQTCYCFSAVFAVHCCTLGKMFTRITPFSTQKIVSMIFPADTVLLNFFYLGDIIWTHSINCHLDLDFKWWTQVSSCMIILMGRPYL
jgi:hypothetical protein